VEGVLNFLEFERFDDCFDFLHGVYRPLSLLPAAMCRFGVSLAENDQQQRYGADSAPAMPATDYQRPELNRNLLLLR